LLLKSKISARLHRSLSKRHVASSIAPNINNNGKREKGEGKRDDPRMGFCGLDGFVVIDIS